MGARQIHNPASLSELLIDLEEAIHRDKAIAAKSKAEIIAQLAKAHEIVGSPCER